MRSAVQLGLLSVFGAAFEEEGLLLGPSRHRDLRVYIGRPDYFFCYFTRIVVIAIFLFIIITFTAAVGTCITSTCRVRMCVLFRDYKIDVSLERSTAGGAQCTDLFYAPWYLR